MSTIDPNRVLISTPPCANGEQAPGCSMTLPEKLRWRARSRARRGHHRSRLPGASRGDWAAVQAVARKVEGPIIAGLARCTRRRYRTRGRCVHDAPRHRLHVFLATSAIHRQHKLNMAKEEIVRIAVEV